MPLLTLRPGALCPMCGFPLRDARLSFPGATIEVARVTFWHAGCGLPACEVISGWRYAVGVLRPVAIPVEDRA